jgi:pimeloyl-ACP methyl ester carboxylesterase
MDQYALDLRDVIQQLDLRNVVLGGHSLGVAVLWLYLDLFGPDRVAKLLFIGFHYLIQTHYSIR